jgi:hypothetical protein
MTRDLIQGLAQQLPSHGPYYQLGFRDEPDKLRSSSAAQRVDLACADPAFGLHVSESYATAALPLPEMPWPGAVLRAHASLRDPNSADVNVALALQLNLPERQPQRDLLRALLICQDNTVQELADLCRLRLEVLSFFETLTWNCRDRCQERIYLAQICQVPGFGRAGGWPRETRDLAPHLLQIAYRSGRTQVVLATAGLAPGPAAESSVETLQNQIVDAMLASVVEGLDAEKVSKSDNPLLEPVLRIVAARQKEKTTTQSEMQRPSPAEAIKLTFQWSLAQTQTNPNADVRPRVQVAGP